MDGILNRVESLDNVHLRAELLKHGEKVGPVTPSTRKVFVNRLAKKLFAIEHPGCDTASENVSGTEAVKERDSSAAAQKDAASNVTDSSSAKLQTSDGQSNKETHSLAYYLVIVPDSATDYRTFTEKNEALLFMKKNLGARLKVFSSLSEVKQFCSQALNNTSDIGSISSKPKMSEDLSPSLPADLEKSAFKGPKIQELVQFRKLVEQGQLELVKRTVWANPRYLVSSADTPVILHEGMRHNALHIAANSNQPGVVTLVLETIEDPEFTIMLYSGSCDTQESRQRRIAYLVDLYLNSPDKGSGESPLHIACKMGFADVVQALIMHSATDRGMVNKFNEKPENIICTRRKGDTLPGVRERIKELLQGLCLVPLLRSEDNITVPIVGRPCSPDKKVKLRGPTYTNPHSPQDPRLTLSAYAGPMSPSKAQEFHKQWSNPRFLRQTLDAGELAVRRADSEKGFERIGRRLARELHVPWTEYWQFLDAFADFSSTDGQQKLELHLRQQQALMLIQSAMSASSTAGSDQEEVSAESSEEDSSNEHYFSCDEGSGDDSQHRVFSNSLPTKRLPEKVARIEASDEDGNVNGESDIFEDSLGPDDFCDLSGGTTQKYLFGQRLNLARTPYSTDKKQKIKQTKPAIENAQSVTKFGTESKFKSRGRGHWMYRDASDNVVEEECKVGGSSVNGDTTKSFDASSSTDVDAGETQHEDNGNEVPKETCQDVLQKGDKENKGPDKSFNTVMTELSEDLECKLVFSPDGKIVRTRKRHCMPDVGVCLGQKMLNQGPLNMKKGKPALDVLIKPVQDDSTFCADVLIHFAPASPDVEDGDSDTSRDDIQAPVTRNVYLDVRVITKNDAVHERVKQINRLTMVTVAMLEEDAVEIGGKNLRCVTARLARAKKKLKTQQTSCFIYGSRPSKTDLDVMRAMCGCKVDGSTFPLVQSWLGLVSATKQEGGDSWPSPSKLRHQHRLSQLQGQMLSGSPHPVSPLVQGGGMTSTPVSRGSLSAICCSRDLSPERLTPNGPRAWLFKSPI